METLDEIPTIYEVLEKNGVGKVLTLVNNKINEIKEKKINIKNKDLIYLNNQNFFYIQDYHEDLKSLFFLLVIKYFVNIFDINKITFERNKNEIKFIISNKVTIDDFEYIDLEKEKIDGLDTIPSFELIYF